MKFPEFIIAGFGRAGTSALLLNLGQHPDIQIALGSGTEIRFWTNPLPFIEKNLDVYKERFNGGVCGEKTPGYILRPHILKTIHEYIPNVKIILCLRNPVDRALSHFELHRRWGRVPKDEEFDFNKHRLVINDGVYINYIRTCLLPSIPKENVYFHIMEWAKKDFVGSISKVYKFLEVEPYSTDIEHNILSSQKNTEQAYMSLFKNNSNYYIWSQKYHKEVSEKEKNKMYKYFKPWNQKLFDFLGYEIRDWSKRSLTNVQYES